MWRSVDPAVNQINEWTKVDQPQRRAKERTGGKGATSKRPGLCLIVENNQHHTRIFEPELWVQIVPLTMGWNPGAGGSRTGAPSVTESTRAKKSEMTAVEMLAGIQNGARGFQ